MNSTELQPPAVKAPKAPVAALEHAPAAAKEGKAPLRPDTPSAGKSEPASGPGKRADAAPNARGDVVARLRRRRARKMGARFALFVLLPTLLASLYFGLIGSDQFESHSVFTVHSAQGRQSLGLDGLIGVVGGAGSRDTLAIRDYVLSRDMLALLVKDHSFLQHYQDSNVDYLSRLATDASLEDTYEYYLDKVQVDFDSASGSLTLRVRAFSPEMSQSLALAITQYSERMVNGLSERERNDTTRYAEREVGKCEKRLVGARQKLLEQQREHDEFNPLATAHGAMAVRTELEGELARAQAELAAARSFMTPTAPRVLELKARASALAGQVAAEKKRLVDPKNEKGIAESLAAFETAMVEKEFAQKAYESSMTALELARAEASRQQRYLAVIAAPSTPDESTYPRRLLGVLTVFTLCFLLLGIGSLLVAAVREHARV